MSSESFSLKVKNLLFVSAVLLVLVIVAWNALNDYLREEDALNSVNRQFVITKMV